MSPTPSQLAGLRRPVRLDGAMVRSWRPDQVPFWAPTRPARRAGVDPMAPLAVGMMARRLGLLETSGTTEASSCPCRDVDDSAACQLRSRSIATREC